MKTIELPATNDSKKYYDLLEKRLKEFFRTHIYYPLLKELELPKNTLQNAFKRSKINPLQEALFTGKVFYSQGAFRGKFNAAITQELKSLGAKFDKKTSTFRILKKDLLPEIEQTILASQHHFDRKMKAIDDKLSKIIPEELSEQFHCADIFDQALWRAEKDFKKNVEKITVTPTLTDSQRQKIADDWQNNTRLSIRGWTKDQIQTLRQNIYEDVFLGARKESFLSPILKITKTLEKDHDKAVSKAKLIAHQETRILMSTFKQVRYQDAGSKSYIWRCVHRPHDPTPKNHILGNVRYTHGKLDGTEQLWSDPPITSNPGESVRRNHPGHDFNCIPGSNLVTLDRPINKIFRRRYTGKLTQLISSDGMIHESTGNHPIFTNRGWIAAEQIQIGDYIFQSKRKHILRKEMNRENMESSIQQIFDALSLCVEIRSDILSKTDFHGDVGIDQEIDIINVDRELIGNMISLAYQELLHFLLQRTDSSSFAFSTSNRFLNSVLTGCFSPDLIGLLGELHTLLFTHFSHSDIIGFRSRTNSNSSLNQPFSNRSSSDSILFGNSKLTHSILIILDSFLNGLKSVPYSKSLFDLNATDSESLAQKIGMNSDFITNFGQSHLSSFIQPLRIIDKTFRNFSSHIYNLETSNNWYYSNGIIIHNCRCFARPVFRVKSN